MHALILGLLSIALTGLPASDPHAELEEHFRGYFASWTADADIPEIVERYWDSAVTLFTPEGTVHLQGAEQVVGMLSGAMQPVIDDGWQRSELAGFGACRLQESLALVAVDYRRHYADGRRTVDSAFYVMRWVDGRWRIGSVTGAESSKLSC